MCKALGTEFGSSSRSPNSSPPITSIGSLSARPWSSMTTAAPKTVSRAPRACLPMTLARQRLQIRIQVRRLERRMSEQVLITATIQIPLYAFQRRHSDVPKISQDQGTEKSRVKASPKPSEARLRRERRTSVSSWSTATDVHIASSLASQQQTINRESLRNAPCFESETRPKKVRPNETRRKQSARGLPTERHHRTRENGSKKGMFF